MTQKTTLVYEPLRSLSSASVSGTYATLGTPLANPSSLIKMVNDSTQDVLVSVDGIIDMDICPAGGFFLYDLVTNHPSSVPSTHIIKGTQFYVKGTAGTGTIYLVTLYTPN